MEQMYFSLVFPLITAKNYECYVQNKHKTLKGGEKTVDGTETLRSKGWPSGEFPGFSFCLMYPRLGAEEARHSGWCQRRVRRERHSHPRLVIMSHPTSWCWWALHGELGLLSPPVKKETMPALVPSAAPGWCQREPAKMVYKKSRAS